ncbi:MAG: hypothetical protein ACHQF2_07815, partial [Flavobacteriales bacterium]
YHFPDSVSASKAIRVPYSLLKKENVPLDSGSYNAVFKFYFDKEKTITGYLLSEQSPGGNHYAVHLCVYSVNEKKFIFHMEVASYVYMEATMEQTTNSWITDLNKDGIKDIATKKYLEDFELPDEGAGNISGGESFIHVFRNGKFEYAYWEEEILPGVSLVK